MSDRSNCAQGQQRQKTLIIIKPDAVEKRVVGNIISRFEKEGFQIEDMKLVNIDKKLASKHYSEHKEKDFFGTLIDYITSGKSLVLVASRPDAIKKAREMMGPTDCRLAKKGTIRGDFGKDITINVIHGSDSPQSAKKEIDLFFG